MPFHQNLEVIETNEIRYVDGIRCEIILWRFTAKKGKYHTAYRFTVPGWDSCKITDLRETRRVIRGRLDPAVRNTLGID